MSRSNIEMDLPVSLGLLSLGVLGFLLGFVALVAP